MENQNINQKKKKDGLKTLLIISIILTAVAAASILACDIASVAVVIPTIEKAFSGSDPISVTAATYVIPYIPWMIFFVMLIGIGIVNIIFSIKTAVKAQHATYVGSVGFTRATFIILPIIAVSVFVVGLALGTWNFVETMLLTYGPNPDRTGAALIEAIEYIDLWVSLAGGIICAVGILQIIFCAINLKGKKKHAVQA